MAKSNVRKIVAVSMVLLFLISAIGGYLAYNYWNRDSDGDGIKDIDEIEKYHTNPNSNDTDNDGINDYDEIFVYKTDPLTPNPNIKLALDLGLKDYIGIVKPLDNDGIQDSNEEQFVKLIAENKRILPIPTFLSYLEKEASDGVITNDELNYSNNFAQLINRLYNEVSNFINDQQKVYINITDYVANLGLKLNFDKEIPSNTTIKTIAYYGIAIKKDNLPEDLQALDLLIRGTQTEKYGNNLVDFEPIVIKDAKGNVINIESSNRARDTWMIAYLLKQRPELVEQPKKFEWINRMMQQVAWNIFDNEYGLNSGWIEPTTGKRHLSENLTPTDEKVWSIILGFHDYMDKLPSQMKKDSLPRFFHYWDSDLLQKEISDKTNRTIVLFYLATLPSVAFNRDTYDYEIGSNGMLLFVKRLPQMYDWIVSAWKNPNLEEYRNALKGYESWLGDRYVHGLENTVKQFSGEWPYEQKGTIDDFLNKNFFAWKFAKFPYAYLRGRGSYGPDFNIPNYGEWEMYDYELPLAYKSVGIPLGWMGGSGTSGNLGGPGNYGHGEFAIYGIPQSVIDALLAAQKSLGRVAVGYGNGVSMMSAIDGFEKDSGYEIWQRIRNTPIYLWKKE